MFRDYSSAEYWDSRYEKDDGVFDWYFDWEEFFEENLASLGINAPVLIVGCGNSDMSFKMEKAGITPIISTDISHTCINKMQKKFGGCYLPMDACYLQFRDGVFSCVIDKGTLDALLCCRHYEVPVTKMMTEIARVLEPGGIFIEITFGKTRERISVLENQEILPWKLEKNITVSVETGDTSVFIFKKSMSPSPINPNGKFLYLYDEILDSDDESD
ncbi:Phosphoethanolamine N-methyltransferase-related protein [Histomonas meleagridis]|uniref:Phosphoethanolamine N-methyltransferase-related protein n=1 Tax=Histomonas meleagridis TaxID=135588 RepID=UPI00355988E0|nr:Phosphoethanolamine N-methyltransferase-related protein [Histomonas meleagridis]KAH0804494.1 Phosphoethanolamine N-methyltransferase-related protein [Histomonas meleagridis]